MKQRSDWNPSDGAPYVLRKRGMFYRHEGRGYTASVFEAELYSPEYAKDYAQRSEATAQPVTDFIPESFGDYVDRIDVLHDVVRGICPERM